MLTVLWIVNTPRCVDGPPTPTVLSCKRGHAYESARSCFTHLDRVELSSLPISPLLTSRDTAIGHGNGVIVESLHDSHMSVMIIEN